jgi:hypothetical protein
MLKSAFAAASLALWAQSAFAAECSGPTAPAPAAVTASNDATLRPQWRAVIARLFDGQSHVAFPAGRAGRTITLKTDKFVCRVSDVANGVSMDIA